MTAEERILGRLRVAGEHKCWVWTGGLVGDPRGGYGKARVGDRIVRVHRWVWQQLQGEPAPELLDHLCHNRRCANPGHLQPSTVQENTKMGLAGVSRMRPMAECTGT